MKEITSNIFYVGVNDRNKTLFEGLWPLPNGVSYNSYLIEDEKVCLVDTVEVDFFVQYLENIREVIADRPIDYLIVNHMEPDHSGSLALIRKYYPNIQIVGNKKTFQMMEGFYGLTDGLVEVKNGDTLTLGASQLQFVLTPMVHWPETMVTLCTAAPATTTTQQPQVLFSGDAFGCFGALNGAIIDSQMNCDTFWLEMVRYYSNIVGKYGTPVQNALKKLRTGGIRAEDITEDYISQHLQTNFMPDPDLLIRTGGELRISNYLLWQIAYSELYFCDTYWPDFDEEHLLCAIESYQNRQRRFGKTEAQIELEENAPHKE